MLRKKRLKCGRIPVRLFLACHQKSNTFKCKQFCCAKPMCACLFMGCAPRPRNAVQQYIARGSQPVARHIRPQTRRSLNECALVRLASQAVPSPVPVSYRTLRRGYGKLDYKIGWVARFYFAIAQVINKSQFIDPFNHIIRLQHMQEQSRQILLSRLKLFMNT